MHGEDIDYKKKICIKSLYIQYDHLDIYIFSQYSYYKGSQT